VQIIEFVTGNPKIVNKVGAAEGTISSAGSAAFAGAFAGLEIAPADRVPGADREAGCAFTASAKIAARNAQTKMIVPNRFTKKLFFSPHGSPDGSNRIAGLKGRRVCLVVKKFTSTFWNFFVRLEN